MPVIRRFYIIHQVARHHSIRATSALVLILLFIGCDTTGRAPAPASARVGPSIQQQPQAESDSAFEALQTQKLLGVTVQEFPPPQGLTGFDELPANAPDFRFTVTGRPLSAARPREWYQTRQSVQARAPDGSVYEAFCGRYDPGEIATDNGFVSTPGNTRQRYGTHHGYGYNPTDVFIGKREAGRLRPTLFFRDVGSHTTAPHHLAIDNQGQVHLPVADVNISQDNRLDLYWIIGNPVSGKWTAAWLIDRRGFTSWAHPWSAARGDKVHLLWNWGDVSVNKGAPGMGIFHVEWMRGGFGRKVRVVSGVVSEWDAAIDPQSGRLLIAFFKENGGVYVLSQPEGGSWTRAALLHPRTKKRYESAVAVEASEGGAFIIRTGSEAANEWVLRPR